MRRVKSKGRHDEVDEVEACKRDLSKARVKGDFKEVSNLYNRIGMLYREMSLFAEALEAHEEEANVTRKYFPNDLLGLGLALRAKAEVYIDMKEEEEALPLVKEYLRLSLAAGDLIEEQRAHVTLGRVYLALALRFAEDPREDEKKLGNLKKAEKEFLVAKDLVTNSKIRISDVDLNEMKCGVYINLFLVLDTAGRDDESLSFLRKAVELAESYSLNGLLFRAHLNFYDVHLRKNEFREAVSSAEAAVHAAKALRDPKSQAEAGLLQAKANFLQNNVEGGVSVLKRIRKDKKKFPFVSEELDALLLSSVRIMRTEDKIHSCTDIRRKAKFFEILGDKYVEIGNFLQATTNYEHAIKIVEANSLGDKKRAELLFSLAETLNDMGKFHDAKKVYMTELSIHEKNDPLEAFKTQVRICSLLEKGNFSEEEILESHRSALRFAKKSGSPAKQLEALGNYSTFLKSRNRSQEFEKVVREADSLRQLCPFAEEESSEKLDDGGQHSDTESTINLNELTSDDEESDDAEEKGPKAIITAKKKFRVNEKGETPLHVAAKVGDLNLVCRLLRQGHEVNPRDSAGWIPLHEAANFGHYAVVEALLKNGARINDQPPGSNCDKITPVHDAAANGHTNVVRLFVDHGANVLLKDATGNYPIDVLLISYQRGKDELTEAQKVEYREILDLLKRKMAESGVVYGKEHERRAKRKAKDCDDEARAEPKFLVQNRAPVKVGLDDFDPDDGDAAVDFYSMTMRGLRGKKKSDESKADQEGPSRQEAQALIAENDYVDEDWLDDDLGNVRGRVNKRKRDCGSEELTLSPRRKKENRRQDVMLPETTRDRKVTRSKTNLSLPRRPSRLQIVSSDDDDDDVIYERRDSDDDDSVEIGQSRTSKSRSSRRENAAAENVPSTSIPSTSRSHKNASKNPSSTITSAPEPLQVFSRPDIRLKDVNALCNSLQYQFSLKEINLSGALLFDDGVKALKTVLPSLKSLATLDLSLNGITREGLNYLREGYSANAQSQPLTSLNLNYNPLGSDAGHSLTELLGIFGNLKKLFLADADLSQKAIEDTSLPSLLAKLQLEELDLRYNDLGWNGKQVLLDSGVFNQIKTFNKKPFDPQFPFGS